MWNNPIETVIGDDAFAPPDGKCESLRLPRRLPCGNPAAVIVKVRSSNGFSIQCTEHNDLYVSEYGYTDVDMLPYSPEKVVELLEIARVRGWHNELVGDEVGR